MKLQTKEFKTTEDGNVIDQLGAIIVMIFIFLMIVAYAAYTRSIQTRLRIDNASKEALYAMEQEGYMSEPVKDTLINNLKKEGVEIQGGDDGFEGTSFEQVAYGDTVTLRYTAVFENPFYKVFNKDSEWFRMTNLDENIEYTVNLSATSKW